MRVLIACEFSGVVRDAFLDRGHDAWSCDLLPSESKRRKHLKIDVREVLDDGWDLMIAHPPCTYLTIAAEWAYKEEQTKKIKPGTLIGAARQAAREEAMRFVMLLANAPIERIAIENPVGVLSSRWREPDQFIQPYEYGDDASKKTCLWLQNLPRLSPTAFTPPRLAISADCRSYSLRWGNQTDSGQNRLSPGDDRWKKRSERYPGILAAMAEQYADRVILTDDNPRTEEPARIMADMVAGLRDPAAVQVEHDRVKAIALAIGQASKQDIILVAGKGHEDYQIIGTDKRHYSDRETVAAALHTLMESFR
jgi:hypothetical protein